MSLSLDNKLWLLKSWIFVWSIEGVFYFRNSVLEKKTLFFLEKKFSTKSVLLISRKYVLSGFKICDTCTFLWFRVD